MMEAYVDRIGDLEGIATRFPGVAAVHAVQAGRELRIHVDEHQVSEKKAAELSERIASKVSEELTFPGQIRITVIREFRALEVAG
jgi:ribonuclease Y